MQKCVSCTVIDRMLALGIRLTRSHLLVEYKAGKYYCTKTIVVSIELYSKSLGQKKTINFHYTQSVLCMIP